MKEAKCQVLSSDEWEGRGGEQVEGASEFRGSKGKTELI